MSKKIKELPPSMAERAILARKLAVKYPNKIQIDDDFLPWMYDDKTNLWYSFDGNYSKTSPEDKRLKDNRLKEYESQLNQQAIERQAEIIYWSGIRQKVLERGNYVCQLCGTKRPSKFHVHHILKRKCNGTDHLDNLITVCPSCHSNLDNKLYNPSWS